MTIEEINGFLLILEVIESLTIYHFINESIFRCDKENGHEQLHKEGTENDQAIETQ